MRAWIMLVCARMQPVKSLALALVLGPAIASAQAPEPPPAPMPQPSADEPTAPPPSDPPATPPSTTPESSTQPTEAPRIDPKFLPPSDPWPPPETFDAQAGASERGFRFGSYGRLLAGTDLRGGKPIRSNVVAHGPRIVEDSYLELDFSYGFDTPSGKRLRPVITLAFAGTLFHDTGDFDAQPAIRNLFLDAQLTTNASAWVGSRMYRGDDIYLFDYWPLDDLNTIGGGLYYRKAADEGRGNVIELAAHAGVNRLTDDFQFQVIEVPDLEQASTTAVQLNRQRMILSGSAAYTLAGKPREPSLKAKVHAEVHALGEGERERDEGTIEQLPADRGYLIGAQLGAFGMAREAAFRRHVNLYVRYAKGLAAFDELAAPTSFGPELKTTRASELTFGAAGNWDTRLGHVMLGALSRRFVDADVNTTDHDDGWEYALAARPLARVVSDVFVGAEVSYQARFPRGINPNTQRAQDPAVFQVAPMIVYSPMGPSGYDRPQLRLVFNAARQNQAAKDQYAFEDVRGNRTWNYFLGFHAEWWFNSSTYR